ncbi:hypothetical protein D3C78_1708000 [compost metagenome]
MEGRKLFVRIQAESKGAAAREHDLVGVYFKMRCQACLPIDPEFCVACESMGDRFKNTPRHKQGGCSPEDRGTQLLY